MRNAAANMLLVLAGLILGVLIAELGVAIFLPQKRVIASAPNIFFIRHNQISGWVNVPGAQGKFVPSTEVPTTQVSINDLGYRGKAIAAAKKPGTRRLLFLGDSNTFGYGVEETERFSDLLAVGLPSTFEVINLGVFGYGTDQEAIQLERDGVGFQPDLVVLCFSAGDLSDNMSSINAGFNKPFFRLANGRPVILNTPVPKSSPLLRSHSLRSRTKRFLYEHSHLYRLLVSRIVALNRFMFDTVAEMSPEEGMQVTVTLIQEMGELCREKRARLVVLLIPHGQWLEGMKQSPSMEIGYYPPLKGMLNGMGIPVIDATPELLKAHQEGTPVFFEKDPVHLNREGNLVVAEVLRRGLSEMGMITVKGK